MSEQLATILTVAVSFLSGIGYGLHLSKRHISQAYEDGLYDGYDADYLRGKPWEKSNSSSI